MFLSLKLLVLGVTTLYHILASWRENKQQKPPGKLIDVGGHKLHLYIQGEGSIPVIIEHSLGGIDGYFLIDEIAKFTKVCIYDRAGYGWSEASPKARCSQEMVRELEQLLQRSGVEPPYLLVGDSFGSYNVRLYAHTYPEKIYGIVLTDGLHESGMLKMPPAIQGLKLFFLSGFIMSTISAFLGLIRLVGNLGIFEFIKPQLRHFSGNPLKQVKRSFYRYNHWLTMARELWNLDISGKQLRKANNLGDIPLISIKASTFFKRSWLNFYLPLKMADRLRDEMHAELLKLSSNVTLIHASKSSHFVWIDEPDIIVSAIHQLCNSYSTFQN